MLAIEEDGRAASSLTLPEGDDDTFDARMRTLIDQAKRIEGDARCADAVRELLEAYARKDAVALARATSALFTMRRARGEGPWLPIRDELPGTTNAERADAFVFGWAARSRALPTASLVRSLLVRAQALLAASQAHAGAVGFGAALRLARDALRDDPAAAARVASAYDALFVDEFQDTSRVQVDLLRLLWERAPRARAMGAMPVFGDMRERGLLVVGDRKQSIYAFRGADVGVFVTTCVELAGAKARAALDLPDSMPLPARTTADFFALRENRRANDALIEFVNDFSRLCLRADGDDLSEARYAESIESLTHAETTRHVSGWRVSWLKPRGEPRDTTRLEDATFAAAYIARTVGDEADDGTPLSFRDFAILAQSNEMLDAAAFALSRAGIPHVVAGRGFFVAREVQDLLALLRWLDRPGRSRRARVGASRSVRRTLGSHVDRSHRNASWSRHGSRCVGTCSIGAVSIEEEDRAPLDASRARCARLRRSAERLGPARTLRTAVRALELEQSLVLLPRGVQRVANVRKLVRIAEEETTIRALLDRVARAEERAREPEAATFSEDDDAVRLVTLHASKGLAFRVVILPSSAARRYEARTRRSASTCERDPAWLATKIVDDRGEPVTTPSIQRLASRDRARLRADRRRLMYVAVTRARERLIFVGGVKSVRSDPSFATFLPDLAVEPREAPVALEIPITSRDEITVGPLALPGTPRTIEVAIAPTALQDFHHCARRFELVHLVQLPEPTPTALGRFREDGAQSTHARAEGEVLHHVLEHVDLASFGSDDPRAYIAGALASADASLEPEAEARVLHAATRFLRSDYARALRDAGAQVWRERAFVLEVRARPEITVTLRGAMDLVARHATGDVDVVDYKRARSSDAKRHAFQLDVYALAAIPLAEGQRVRAGAVFLGGDAPPEPHFRPSISRAKLEERIAELAKALLEARRARTFVRAPTKTCHAIGCGYFTLCHPRTEKRQLTLFR